MWDLAGRFIGFHSGLGFPGVRLVDLDWYEMLARRFCGFYAGSLNFFSFSSAHGGVGFAGVGFGVVGLVVMVSHSCRLGCEGGSHSNDCINVNVSRCVTSPPRLRPLSNLRPAAPGAAHSG